MNLTTKQEYKDFFYGKALRLADELGCWDQAILDMMFFTSVEQYRAYCVELEAKVDAEKYLHETTRGVSMLQGL
jgi:hypothetical protein